MVEENNEFIKIDRALLYKITENIIKKDEKLLYGFAYGKRVFDDRWSGAKPAFLSHLIVTNQRLIIIPAGWFEEKEDYQSISFEKVKSCKGITQVMGSTLVVEIEIENKLKEYTFDNCPKREAEAATIFISKVMGKKQCHSCFSLIEDEFYFCPYCEVKLKSFCSSCKKLLQKEWKICPYCGSKHLK